MTDAEFGAVCCAALRYKRNGTAPEFEDRTVRTVGRTVVAQLDREHDAYTDEVKRTNAHRGKGGKFGGMTPVSGEDKETAACAVRV